MDLNSADGRLVAQLVSKLEVFCAQAITKERQRWSESYQALQREVDALRSENVRLKVQVQSHHLESTNRAKWLKRKAESDASGSRPAKISRRDDTSSQDFAPPTPESSRALSAGVEDEVEGLGQVSVSNANTGGLANQSGATSGTQRPRRRISMLPSRARTGDNAPPPRGKQSEEERVVYCLCGGHEYGLMIHCDNPKCELTWFHAGCVNLKEVPLQEEEWFCPACVEPHGETATITSSRYASIAVQAATASAVSACQTDPEPSSRTPSPPLGSAHRNLPPIIVPRIETSKVHHLSRSPSEAQMSEACNQESSSSMDDPGQAPGLLAHESESNDVAPSGPTGNTSWTLIVDKLTKSSKPSLFRMLQPTGRKPWVTNSDV